MTDYCDRREPSDYLIRFSGLAVLLTLCVLLLGVATRLLDAGLGCPDWPGCYGRLAVPSAEQAALVSSQPLEPIKAWMEMIHRYAAGLLGVLALVCAALCLRQSHRRLRLIGIALPLLIGLQGAFGMWTVTLRLWPVVVTAHLLGGLSCLVLFFWLRLSLRSVAEQPLARQSGSAVNPLYWLALLVLLLQISLGGWTSSNYAGVGCIGLPQCNGEWWPQADFAQGFHLSPEIGHDYLHGQLDAVARTAIHLSHRLGAVLLGIVLLALAYQQRSAERRLRKSSRILLLLYGCQLLVAAVMIAWSLPVSLALLHTLIAALLLLTLVYAGFYGMARQRARQLTTEIQPAEHRREGYGH